MSLLSRVYLPGWNLSRTQCTGTFDIMDAGAWNGIPPAASPIHALQLIHKHGPFDTPT